jgi:hypothetical protein
MLDPPSDERNAGEGSERGAARVQLGVMAPCRRVDQGIGEGEPMLQEEIRGSESDLRIYGDQLGVAEGRHARQRRVFPPRIALEFV